MALTKQQKKDQIEGIKDKIKNQKSIVFVDFSKVPSDKMFSLRKKLKEDGCALKIGKKTLIRIAFGQTGLSFWQKIKKNIPGQLALVFGIKDEISPARISHQFSKENDNFKILGGVFENRFIEKETVLSLANLPSRKELLAKAVGSMASPLSGFVNVLQGNITGLVRILSQIKK